MFLRSILVVLFSLTLLPAQQILEPVRTFRLPKAVQDSPDAVLIEPDRLTVSALPADERWDRKSEAWIWDGVNGQLLRTPVRESDWRGLAGCGFNYVSGPVLHEPMERDHPRWDPAEDGFRMQGSEGWIWSPRRGWQSGGPAEESKGFELQCGKDGSLNITQAGRETWNIPPRVAVPDLGALMPVLRMFEGVLGYQQVAVSSDGNQVFTQWKDFEVSHGRFPYRSLPGYRWALWRRGQAGPVAEGILPALEEKPEWAGAIFSFWDSLDVVVAEGPDKVGLLDPRTGEWIHQAKGFRLANWPRTDSILVRDSQGGFSLLFPERGEAPRTFNLAPLPEDEGERGSADFSPDGRWMSVIRYGKDGGWKGLDLFDLGSVLP